MKNITTLLFLRLKGASMGIKQRTRFLRLKGGFYGYKTAHPFPKTERGLRPLVDP